MNRIIFLTILFLNLFLNPLLSEEPPSKLPPCDTSLKKDKWNNCYKRVIFNDGFEYHGEWKRGLFHGKGKIILPEGLSEEGEWIEGNLKWQIKYNRKEHLTGIWEIKTNSINEKIYFNGQWIGFLNTDFVCRILFTERPFIRNKNAKNYGVKKSTFIVLNTDCKDHKFQKVFQTSFDNIFITNEGELVLFQTKILKENEEINPVWNTTFPNGIYYDSFEKKDVGFLILKKITKNISKEDFFSKFKHHFNNN